LRGSSVRGGFLIVEVLVAMVLLGAGISGAMVLLFHSVRILHQADLVSRAAPQVMDLAERGPVGFDPGSPLPESPEDPASEPSAMWMEWWWEDGDLVVRHHLTGQGASVGRRIHVPWAGGIASIPLEAEAGAEVPEPEVPEPEAPESER
jgi:hypothetical protein